MLEVGQKQALVKFHSKCFPPPPLLLPPVLPLPPLPPPPPPFLLSYPFLLLSSTRD